MVTVASFRRGTLKNAAWWFMNPYGSLSFKAEIRYYIKSALGLRRPFELCDNELQELLSYQTRLIMVRHGETYGNPSKIVQGHKQGMLTG